MVHRTMESPIRSILACEADHHDGVVVHMRNLLRRTLARLHLAHSRMESTAAPLDDRGAQAVLLAFPVRGEALLLRLAEGLRDRLSFAATEQADPFFLTLSRGSRPRLSIDRDAYVEFHAESTAFHLIIDATPESRVTLETTDFDTLVRFVMQYVAEECRGLHSFEAAS
jgi:hypothetical protein